MPNLNFQSRFSSSFKVDFPDFPSISQSAQARSVQIIKEIGKHDIALINYTQTKTAVTNLLKTGTPVKIIWRNDKYTGEFYGYVSEFTPTVAQQQQRETIVTCVGTTFPAKERQTKIWINKTASEVATDIINKLGLKPVVTSHPTRFTQQSLTGQSYWEKLNQLAEKIGYFVQGKNSEVHFHPVDKMINRFMTSIPVLSFQNIFESPESSYVSPTLTRFLPRSGDFFEDVPFTRTEVVLYGVDPITGKTYKSTSSASKVGKPLRTNIKDPLFNSVETKTVTASAAMAKSLAEARAQLGRFTIKADGAGLGDPRVTPWGTIEIKGTGNLGDGFWVIKKVEHVILGDGRYTMEFQCLSDGNGSNSSSAFRPMSAGQSTRNIQDELSNGTTTSPTSITLKTKKPLIKQTKSGYKVTPSKWKKGKK